MRWRGEKYPCPCRESNPGRPNEPHIKLLFIIFTVLPDASGYLMAFGKPVVLSIRLSVRTSIRLVSLKKLILVELSTTSCKRIGMWVHLIDS